jgi:sigma-B regulation protein RsbU (phosphoserine phosphatase)
VDLYNGRSPLSPGAGVLLYTDGVLEARQDGELFGQQRLAQSVQTLGGRAASEVVAGITAEIQEFATTGLADDLCVVAARISQA